MKSCFNECQPFTSPPDHTHSPQTVVLFLARLTTQKGVPVLLATARQLCESMFVCTFTVEDTLTRILKAEYGANGDLVVLVGGSGYLSGLVEAANIPCVRHIHTINRTQVPHYLAARLASCLFYFEYFCV